MENDIAPKLDKLKKEKSDFMNFQKIEGEVERLRRFLVAYDFCQSEVCGFRFLYSFD
jgi:structural maintenance of chromosome 2